MVVNVVTGQGLTWGLIVSHLELGGWGRPRGFLIGAVCGNLLAAALAVGAYVFFFSGYGASVNRLVYFPLLPWVVAVALIGKFSAAAWALTEARRRGLLTARFILGYVLLWCAATACLVATADRLLPDLAWRRHLAVFSAVLLFPLARIGLATLALAWNRHQRSRIAQ